MSKATKAMLRTWINTFVAAIITAAIAVFASNGGSLPLDGQTWLGVLVAGVVAVLPVIRNYFDKGYSLYGKGSATE
jgi:hypothetical protein